MTAPLILPVIHYADDNQAMRNAERAFEAGCAGVMLIEMQGRDTLPVWVAGAIRRRWPERLVGMNRLNATTSSEILFGAGLVPDAVGLDMTWTDQQITHTTAQTMMEVKRLRRALQELPGHLLFCGVAFKYQPHEPNPRLAAHVAVEHGFIPTTSGPATGEAADPSLLASIRRAIGPDAPLAVASGVTPENVGRFAPLVSHILVSTGVSASFHEFDPDRLRALVEAVR